MRRFVAGSAAVLAAVLLPLALLSSWVAGVVTDTDEYVSTVAPLAEDEDVKDAATRLLTREAITLLEEIVGPIANAAAAPISSAARAAVDSEAFPPAWRAANRSAHSQLVNALELNDSGLPDGRVSLSLSTLVNTVLGQVGAQFGVPADQIPRVDASFGLVRGDDLERVRHAYQLLDRLGYWSPVLWLASLVAAVAASDRRASTLRRLGGAAVVTMALLYVVLELVRQRLLSGSPDDVVVGAVWDVVTRDLERQVWVVGGLGLVAVLVVTLLGRRQQGSR